MQNKEAKSTITAVSGPLRGQSFPVNQDEIYLGRGSSCEVQIHDSSISRKHCLLKKEKDGHRIVDLQSLNGTYVNGIPVREQLLNDGNQIELGESVFVYFRSSDKISGDPKPTSTIVLRSTLELLPSPGFFLKDPVLRAKSYTYDSKALLDFLVQLQMALNPQDFLSKFTSLLPAVLPLSRGSVWLNSERPAICFDSKGPADCEITVDPGVIHRVFHEHIALLCEVDSRSRSRHLVSVLCVPFSNGEKSEGAIYVESARQKKFDETHLQILTAIGFACAAPLQQILKIRNLEMENLQLDAALHAKKSLIGTSEGMREIHRVIGLVAPTDANVLILGQTGTGKEMVARAIHRSSRRSKGPFVAINCAAIPESLMESELFGYKKGAFTGAVQDRKGKIESAMGGTLFFDEIADLPAYLQAKLLRVIQEREVEPLGSAHSVSIDVRLIAATNRDLRKTVRDGSFREDLFHRLNTIEISLPALRERTGDIPLLAHYFLRICLSKMEKEISGISPAALTVMSGYDWPGNIRELENVIERAAIMTSSSMITVEDLPPHFQTKELGDTALEYHKVVADAKKRTILAALKESKGNHKVAAELLGLQRTYLHQLIRKFRINHTFEED